MIQILSLGHFDPTLRLPRLVGKVSLIRQGVLSLLASSREGSIPCARSIELYVWLRHDLIPRQGEYGLLLLELTVGTLATWCANSLRKGLEVLHPAKEVLCLWL